MLNQSFLMWAAWQERRKTADLLTDRGTLR
ncbi:hypothetical protein NSPZN2_50274 [Nitrospira defluvii]|uniref:Uncharacterized protein n=1 Tax=Nitrospira defluvii TaxID=330214 RepID=A0ABM8S5C2_9BACT|nr:hypothetical protein NSPZN2_50274 [Nitrospira defluvii]